MEKEKELEPNNGFVPIGSILVVKGDVKKLMVVARGVLTKMGDTMQYFDYGACKYPEGILGDSMFYFHKDDIQEVISLGYADEDEARSLRNLVNRIKELKGKGDHLGGTEGVQ